MLPRHLKIIYQINYHFLKEVTHLFPGDSDMVRRMTIIDENGGRRVRMAHLAIIGSHKVNGVAKLHTELMKNTIFADFNRVYPDKIVNKTNGITPRRWLHHCNPLLTGLITSRIGHEWITRLDEMKKIISYAEDTSFIDAFIQIKRANKQRLAKLISKNLMIEVNIDSLFDVQIKRMHEYKRQLLNLLHVVTLYNRIRSGNSTEIVPRTVIFAGKAAPGYAMAKLIIKLINDVADIVNHDPAAV